MENLIIEETKYTPLIKMDTNGTIELVGKSYPENTFEFYVPMMEWVKEYFETSAADVTTVNMEITYFNQVVLNYFLIFLIYLKRTMIKRS